MKWYYTVGEDIYFNRLEATVRSNETHKPIYFHAPEGYKDFDFSKPITDSLEKISIELAQKLRDEHGRVIFWYSGGTDSDWLLDLYVQNNIQIDEIVCLKSGFKDSDFEIENFAIPKLEKIKSQIPKTKITIMQPTLQDYLDYYQNIDQDKIDKGCLNFGLFIRLIQQNFFMNYNKQDKDIIILAKEKPEIVKVDEIYYTYFVDVALEPNPILYNFFIDEPHIHAKQSQLWLESIKAGKDNTYPDDRVYCLYGRDLNDYPDKAYYYGTDTSIVFNNRKIKFQNNKERCAIEYCIKNCPQVVELWTKCLDKIIDMTGTRWWNEGHPEMLPVGVFSKFYCLDKKDTKTVDDLYPNGFKP